MSAESHTPSEPNTFRGTGKVWTAPIPSEPTASEELSALKEQHAALERAARDYLEFQTPLRWNRLAAALGRNAVKST